MTRCTVVWLLVFAALLVGCTKVNDFDAYRFQSPAGREDAGRKPARDGGTVEPDAGAVVASDAGPDSEAVAEAGQDASRGAPDAGDAGQVEPVRDGAVDAQSAPDAAAAPDYDGTWDVLLEQVGGDCGYTVPLDADTWVLDGRDLSGTTYTLRRTTATSGVWASDAVTNRFGARWRVVATLQVEGDVLTGTVRETSLDVAGCEIVRLVEGDR